MNVPGISSERLKIPFFSRLQVQYAISYLTLLATVLALLNTYPMLASQDLLFSSKEDFLKSQTAVISSALVELETLSPDQVSRVMNTLNNMGLEHILVTDPAGMLLYNSLEQSPSGPALPSEALSSSASAPYVLLQEIVLALKGHDVFYSRYQNGVFHSTAAAPILYRGMIIGAVYICDQDSAQGALLMSLQKNLQSISLILVVIALVISVLFSRILTARITALLRAIRVVGRGDYGHRLQILGTDELADLAREFNQLTDRLQNIEEVRRRFVSDASHELKTPLASIRLLADSILQNQEIDGATTREFVSDIGSEAERLTRITEHLLALTRIDSLPLGTTQVVDLSAISQAAVTTLLPVAEEAQVVLQGQWSANCTLRGIEDDFYQVALNLIENAIKYNFPGGSVCISVQRCDQLIHLRVTDTGVGIPEEERDKIFHRFYRVDKARSRAAGGTGLGLSIVHDMVRRHRGRIALEPNSPQGSIFLVTFPYEPRNHQEVEP